MVCMIGPLSGRRVPIPTRLPGAPTLTILNFSEIFEDSERET